MDILKNAKKNISKITIISGCSAWLLNTICYILNVNEFKFIYNICLFLSFIYTLTSISLSIYYIKMTNRKAATLAFLYWATILILTLPIILETFGMLSPHNSQNKFYISFITFLNAPLFGFSYFVPQIIMQFIIIIISSIQILLLMWGVCKILP